MKKINKKNTLTFLLVRKVKGDIYNVVALALLLLWLVPFVSTGQKIEYGDFSFFAQAYEAIRVSILEYRQFPWWNPWMNGGVPLYANPQMGVFSIQTILVLLFGTVIGLKLAIAFYTIAGYFSMRLLLRHYFKVNKHIAAPLSLAWVLSSFFIAHLPPHFTFVWFMLTPLYIYLALTVNSYKSALLFGLALAVMALSAVHYALFYIFTIVGVIILTRFILGRDIDTRKSFIFNMLISAAVFILLAGHRVVLTTLNAVSFDREVTSDPSLSLKTSILAIVVPFKRTLLTSDHSPYPGPPIAPFGWGETTATIGVVLTITAVALVVLTLVQYQRINKLLILSMAVIIASGVLFFAIGMGNHGPISPYWYIKSLPIFENLRVSSRLFVFFNLSTLLLIGLAASKVVKRRNLKVLLIIAIYLGCAELYITNFWYQNNVFTRTPATAPRSIRSYEFDQTNLYGQTILFPNNKSISGSATTAEYYREYEATTFNIGVIRANEALVNNMYAEKVRCAIELYCGLVLSNNARITYWSPNKIVLERTATGPIRLNVNATSYVTTIDGRRTSNKTADALRDLVIQDNSQQITLQYRPSYKL